MWRGRCQHWVRLPTKKPNTFRAPRLYSVLRPRSVETVQVTCGSSGHINLNIYNNPPGPTTRPLIIYIPSLSLGNFINPPPIPNALLNNTVIQIDPRWSPTHLFPHPIHDTLHAYNWILANLTKTPPTARPRPIAIYGTHLGGSLATSLALTESRPCLLHRPTISVLAVQNAIFDWSKIASSPPPDPSPPLSQDPDLPHLYTLREQLFRDPAGAFDAFASPLLFFRTTGLAIPSAFPKALLPEAEAALEHAGGFVSRKSHLTFPPKQSGLRIPVTRIAVSGAEGKGEEKGRRMGRGKGEDGSRGVLREQAEEMVKLMRRSVVLHEGKERRDGGFDGVVEAERRVGLVELGSREAEVDDGEWAAEFFEEVLGKE